MIEVINQNSFSVRENEQQTLGEFDKFLNGFVTSRTHLEADIMKTGMKNGCKRNGRLCSNCGKVHKDCTGSNNHFFGSHHSVIFKLKQKVRMIRHNPMYNRKSVKKRIKNIDYEEIGKKISITRTLRIKEGKIISSSMGKKARKENSEKMKKNNPMKNSKIVKKGLETKKRNGNQSGWIWSTKSRRKLSKTNSGVGNVNYKGGSSKKKYDEAFNSTIKKEIRKRENRICPVCLKTEKKNERHLTVHHIDLTMSNSIKDNLIGMCLSCHQIYHMTRDDKVRKRINKKIKTYMRCLK